FRGEVVIEDVLQVAQGAGDGPSIQDAMIVDDFQLSLPVLGDGTEGEVGSQRGQGVELLGTEFAETGDHERSESLGTLEAGQVEGLPESEAPQQPGQPAQPQHLAEVVDLQDRRCLKVAQVG